MQWNRTLKPLNETLRWKSCLPKEKQETSSTFIPVANVDEIAAKATALANRHDVYMPIALFPSALSEGRGTIKDASHLIGFFGDIDTLEKPNPKHKYAPNKEAALQIVRELPFKPTYITNSGFGLHVLWLFPEPLAIRDEAHRTKLQALYKKFQAMLSQAFAKHNYELDKVGDIVRVFRIPGTSHRKDKNNIRPVIVLEYNPEVRASINQIQAYLEQHFPDSEKPSTGKKKHRKGEPDVELIRKECKWLEHTFSDAKELSETEWYAALSIIGHCKDAKKIAHEFSKPYPEL